LGLVDLNPRRWPKSGYRHSKEVPPSSGYQGAAHHKQTERDSYDWPICDVAVVLRLERGTVRSAVIAMGWVAPTPRRAQPRARSCAGAGSGREEDDSGGGGVERAKGRDCRRTPGRPR
jgi:xanthine dehydrogenase iron-sulfur cluster and FAD-binding subunit A